MVAPGVPEVGRALLQAHGPQRWWPAGSSFEVMVGAVLTQNTAWTNVERAIATLRAQKVLQPQRILAVHHRRLAAWLKPTGYYNLKTRRLRALCTMVVESGGVAALRREETVALRQRFLAVNGVGPETADDILLYAFKRPVCVIDAYTRRLFSRLGVIRGDEDYESLRQYFECRLGRRAARLNEFHALIVRHAKEICRPRPRCDACVLANQCRSRDPRH